MNSLNRCMGTVNCFSPYLRLGFAGFKKPGFGEVYQIRKPVFSI